MISNEVIGILGSLLILTILLTPLIKRMFARKKVPIQVCLPEVNVIRYDPYSGTLRALKDER